MTEDSAIKKIIGTLLLFFSFFPAFVAASVQVVTTGYPPYQMQENGKTIVISTEVVRAILKKAHVEGTFVIYPWARAYRTAQNHPDALIYSLSRTSEREDLFHWIGAITPNRVYLWKLHSRKDITPDSLRQIEKYTYGVLRNDVKRHYLLEQGIPEENLQVVVRDRQNFQKLFMGRIDLMPYDEMAFIYKANRYGHNLAEVERVRFLSSISGDAYLAANKSMPKALVAKLIRAFEQIKEDGTYEAILQKYMAGSRR